MRSPLKIRASAVPVLIIKLQPLALAVAMGVSAGANAGANAGESLAATATQQPAVLRGDSPSGVAYSANQDVAQIKVQVAADNISADGQTATAVTLQLLGADGKLLAGSHYVTIEHSAGRILLPGAGTAETGPAALDADKATAGVQLKVVQGQAGFQLLAPYEPQQVLLRITAGNQSAQGLVRFVPEMREMLATGFVEGVITFHNNQASLLQPARSNDGFEQEIRRWERDFNQGKANAAARTAFFLKGKIKGEYLLTASFDSDKETRARFLRDIRPDEYYPVYGDSSLMGYDARSADRLYLRLDKNRSYLLYGDFQTNSGTQAQSVGAAAGLPANRSLGLYSRSATGVNWHYENDRLQSNVFAMQDNLRQVVEEFPTQGSGPYALRNNAVYQGSERVEVVTRDRNQPSRILTVRPLSRLIDYNFEVFSGRILLNQFLPSFDASLNPVSLRVTYEVDQGTEMFWAGGSDAQLQLSSALAVGGSYAEDKNPFAPHKQGSFNSSYRLGDNTMLVAEVARTEGEVNTNAINQFASTGLRDIVGETAGNAWRLELAHDGERFDSRIFAGQSDPTFQNIAAPLYGGRGEYSADLAYATGQDSKLYLEGLRSVDRNPNAGERSSIGAGHRWQATERLTIDAGLRRIQERVGQYSAWQTANPFGDRRGLSGSLQSGAAGGALGFGQQPLDPLTGLPLIYNGGNYGGMQSDLPLGTELESDTARLGLGWRASDKTMLGAEVEQDIYGEDRQRYAVGADYQLRERQRLYSRFERETGLSSVTGVTTKDHAANTFVAGVDSTLFTDTQLFNEYRLRDAFSGKEAQAASGVRNDWQLSDALRISSSVEHINVLSGLTGDATGAAVGADYSANPLWRSSGRVELRRTRDSETTPGDEAFDTGLVQLTFGRKLNRDWTALLRNYLLQTDYSARGDVTQNRSQLGFAYRDTDSNKVNGLLRYEYKTERDFSGLAQGDVLQAMQQGLFSQDGIVSHAHIFASHLDYHPSRPWWATARFAMKWQQDTLTPATGDKTQSKFKALLLSGRVVYDITENWDIGLMSSGFYGDLGANQYAYGIELGHLLQQNLWISVGYNAKGFVGDKDLTRYEYTQQGVFLRLRFKFDETLFMADPYVAQSARLAEE